METIEEMKVDTLKIEPTEDDVQKPRISYSAQLAKDGINSTPRHEVQNMIINEQHLRDFPTVFSFLKFLEDYNFMACSFKSLYCRQLPTLQALVTCPVCGARFVGKSDRLLKLCRHFESLHPFDVMKLIIGSMDSMEEDIKKV